MQVELLQSKAAAHKELEDTVTALNTEAHERHLAPGASRLACHVLLDMRAHLHLAAEALLINVIHQDKVRVVRVDRGLLARDRLVLLPVLDLPALFVFLGVAGTGPRREASARAREFRVGRLDELLLVHDHVVGRDADAGRARPQPGHHLAR